MFITKKKTRKTMNIYVIKPSLEAGSIWAIFQDLCLLYDCYFHCGLKRNILNIRKFQQDKWTNHFCRLTRTHTHYQVSPVIETPYLLSLQGIAGLQSNLVDWIVIDNPKSKLDFGFGLSIQFCYLNPNPILRIS